MLQEFRLINITKEKVENFYHQLTSATKRKLTFFLNELQPSRTKYNLTAIKDSSLLFDKFVLESLALFCLPLELDNKNFLDMGSGAGIPGAIIAIVNPKAQLLSVDKSPVKIKFQMQLKEKLALDNLTPECERLEHIQLENKFDYVLARAYKKLSHSLPQALKLLRKGGHAIMWKGQRWPDEWQATAVDIRQKYKNLIACRYDISSFSGGSILVLEKKSVN